MVGGSRRLVQTPPQVLMGPVGSAPMRMISVLAVVAILCWCVNGRVVS